MMMTGGGDGSDRSMSRRGRARRDGSQATRAFGGGATNASASSPSGRVRLTERIQAIINHLNQHGPLMVDRVSQNSNRESARHAKANLDDAVTHLKIALKAVDQLSKRARG
jgi:hypothetical protein